MKKICVLTATRAEYGLLKNVILKLSAITELEVFVAVTGMHLSPEFGLTYREIEQDGIPIDKKIEILLSADTPSSISKSMGLALIGFSDYFAEKKPDLLLVLGDRFETLAVCIAAMNQRIPIAHLYGGETTEGAVDEAIRHAITKLSYLHFTSTEKYRERVIQLGEAPERVFSVGAMGIENIHLQKLMSKQELERNLQFDLGENYAVVTYHPVTLEDGQEVKQIQELFMALTQFEDMHYIITKANADAGGRAINQVIDDFGLQHPQTVLAVESLGTQRYLSALQSCMMVIGNSSSGLVEAPSFHIPTINIGDRQKGRMKSESVIDCKPVRESIAESMKYAMTNEMQAICRQVANPYGDGCSSDKIADVLENQIKNNKIQLKKEFYDIET